MATTYKLKRSTVSGVTPTTGDITTAELAVNLADRKLFTSNGTAVFELGANLASLSVTGNTTLSNNVTIDGTLSTNNTITDSKGETRTLVFNTQTTSYTLVANDHGKLVSTNTTVIIPASIFTAGQNITVYNNSAASITINATSVGITCYLAGTATTGSRTLSQRGIATIVCVATANTFIISGAGLS